MTTSIINLLGMENDPFITISPWLRARDSSDVSGPQSSEEWEQWSFDVVRAGLSGIVLERVRAMCIELPEVVEHRLKAAASTTVAANLHREHELARLVNEFERSKIPVMLLKGAALQRTIYDHPALRPMSDIDLLVRPSDVTRAMEVLAASGCRKGASLLRDDFFPRYYYETEWFVESAGEVRIDLHARPFRPLRVSRFMPDDALWHDAAAVRVGNATAYIPRAESMLIHLAAHAAFHGCERLIWLYDIKRFIEHAKQELDWSLVVQSCCEWRLSLPVLTALQRVQEVLGSCCPESALIELQNHNSNWQDRLTLKQAPRDAAQPFRHVLINLACTPGVAYRFGYLLAMLTPHRSHLAEVYPYRHRGWTAMANAWRCVRMIGRLVRSPFRRMVARS